MCLQLQRDVPGAAGQLLEELAELSERTGYMCRGGRRPADLYSKLGVGQRMQHTVGDLCSGLLFVLCYLQRNKGISAVPGGRKGFAAGCESLGSQRIKSCSSELTRVGGLVTCQNYIQ